MDACKYCKEYHPDYKVCDEMIEHTGKLDTSEEVSNGGS